MTSLESIVLPLAESRALVEQNIVLDTAMAWYPIAPSEEVFHAVDGDTWVTGREPQEGDATEFVFGAGELVDPICPAPVLSELLDAIRAAVSDMDAGCSFGIYKVDGTLQHGVAVDWVDVKDWEADRHKGAYSSTDLLAAAALLMEVSK